MRYLATLFSMVLLLGLVTCAAAEELSGEDFYRGQVLDHATEKPLAGVLVVFYWQRDVYSPKGITSEYHAASEVLTDAHGRFKVSAGPEKARDPSIYHIASPAIIFFAPGYIHSRIEKNGGFRIHMRQVKDPRDALDLGLQPGFPNHHTPLLLKALNNERARLGLPLIQPLEGANK